MMRQTFGRDKVFIVGMTTHEGSVTATYEWGEQAKVLQLNPSLGLSLALIGFYKNYFSTMKRKRNPKWSIGK
tara:strand:+ start:322 stop:537 length:216 start_codon:yes stop_codon:yes gene_type:complete